MTEKQLAIIGGGPGGMAAALSAWEAGVRDIVILEREERLGGILKQCIHDGFGLERFGEMISGPEYARRYAALLEKTGVRVETNAMVTSLLPDKTITAVTRRGVMEFHPGAVVLATGCRERTRGAITIPGTRPAGVYTAGVVQNLMNCRNIRVGERIVILGGGDIGLIMARRLTYEGAKVLAVLELQPEPGGLQRNISQCLYDFGIPLYLSRTVAEIRGRDRVRSVVAAQVDEHGKILPDTRFEIECDTLILSVGLIPENELAGQAGIRLDGRTNGIVADEYLQTSAAGIFACGNAKAVMDLADHVSKEGALAGRNAAHFLLGQAMERRGSGYESRMAKGLPKEGSVTCILCPNGCQIEQKDGKWSGNRCPRGEKFAQQEQKEPMRTLTMVLRTVWGGLLPVRTDRPIPKAAIFPLIEYCKKQCVSSSCMAGDVLIENAMGTGVDLIACDDFAPNKAVSECDETGDRVGKQMVIERAR